MRNISLEMTILFDFYGDILTDKQRELFDLYYNEDLSLAEISEHMGISRQGVRDGIVRAEEILNKLESKLGLAAKYGKISDDVSAITEAAEKIKDLNDVNYRNTDLDEYVNTILSRVSSLSE
ncbi:MAG: YlxM family DNA-binding protein [Clostridiales bacterium]|jgi:predicted DNA-binding protein YlxM (UPF0122 family)|nr:YlxM family DNA-binding protein [Clostridiales bacterium]